MTKSDLVGQLAKKLDVSYDTANAAVETTLNLIRDSLVRGEAVKIRNLGSFFLKYVAGRDYKSPIAGIGTGRSPDKIVIKWRTAPELDAAVNSTDLLRTLNPQSGDADKAKAAGE